VRPTPVCADRLAADVVLDEEATVIGCRLCHAVIVVGELYCRDEIACNARARAALGMSSSLCGLWKLRDLQRLSVERRPRRAA
jgi:hypothetical protein